MPINNTDPSSQPCGVILVVDDEEFNRQLLRDALDTQGHTVIEATCGDEALHLAQLRRPDVILLDVMMPNMDGFQVCSRLKGDPDTRSIPVIMVTALSERKDKLKGIQCGASDFLGKPIDLTEVVLRVRNAVQNRRLLDEVQKSYDRYKELEVIRDKLIHLMMRELRFPVRGAVESIEPLHRRLAERLDSEEAAVLAKALAELKTLDAKLESVGELTRKAA